MAPYQYLNKTADLLDKANQADNFEQKMQYINESIRTYGQGPNLAKLQMLTSLNTNEKMNYVLPDVKAEINDEFSSHADFVRGVKIVAAWIAFLLTTIYSTIIDYNSKSDGEKHFILGVTFVSLLIVLVLI